MNSLKLYDISLTSKLKSIFTNVTYASPDEALESSSDDKSDINFPMISLYRLDNPPIFTERYNNPSAFRGRMNSYTQSGYRNIMTLPVNLSYQIDLWSSTRDELDTMYCELLFYLVRYPNIEINIDSGTHNFPINITDAESLMDFDDENSSRTYRMSITLEVPDAVLFYLKDYSVPNFSDNDGNITYNPISVSIGVDN